MKPSQQIHQANLAKWKTLIQEQTDSGLTIKEWCDQNDVSIHAFYYWKRIAKAAYVNSIMPEIVPIPVDTPSPIVESDSNGEVELYNSYNLQKSSAFPSQNISVSIGDIVITIGASASDDMISGIIKAVRHA